MPQLTIRNIFISHAWRYSKHYWTIVNWFDNTPYFYWRNYSVPEHDSCDEKTSIGLTNCILRQMRPAQYIIILGGMYTAHSDWIRFELEEAHRMGKIIIGVRPWGQERMPQIIQELADEVVGWNRDSVINAVRRL